MENDEPKERIGIRFAEFLERTPPGRRANVRDLLGGKRIVQTGSVAKMAYPLVLPPIQLHCPFNHCNGKRVFRHSHVDQIAIHGDRETDVFIRYRCGNCEETTKTYAVHIAVESAIKGAECIKFGEIPTFGPPLPSQLISLIGPERDALLNGFRAENLGLGIGAFTYYRRVVESQKDRIIDKINSVCERIKAPEAMIGVLQRAKSETQFTNASDSIKDAVPQSLLLDGHNPLKLLHSALSEGLHADTDEECLELAASIRLVLCDLSERIATTLKDHAELNRAVSRLLAVKDKSDES